jgi:hypothetical protein
LNALHFQTTCFGWAPTENAPSTKLTRLIFHQRKNRLHAMSETWDTDEYREDEDEDEDEDQNGDGHAIAKAHTVRSTESKQTAAADVRLLLVADPDCDALSDVSCVWSVPVWNRKSDLSKASVAYLGALVHLDLYESFLATSPESARDLVTYEKLAKRVNELVKAKDAKQLLDLVSTTVVESYPVERKQKSTSGSNASFEDVAVKVFTELAGIGDLLDDVDPLKKHLDANPYANLRTSRAECFEHVQSVTYVQKHAPESSKGTPHRARAPVAPSSPVIHVVHVKHDEYRKTNCKNVGEFAVLETHPLGKMASAPLCLLHTVFAHLRMNNRRDAARALTRFIRNLPRSSEFLNPPTTVITNSSFEAVLLAALQDYQTLDDTKGDRQRGLSSSEVRIGVYRPSVVIAIPCNTGFAFHADLEDDEVVALVQEKQKEREARQKQETKTAASSALDKATDTQPSDLTGQSHVYLVVDPWLENKGVGTVFQVTDELHAKSNADQTSDWVNAHLQHQIFQDYVKAPASKRTPFEYRTTSALIESYAQEKGGASVLQTWQAHSRPADYHERSVKAARDVLLFDKYHKERTRDPFEIAAARCLTKLARQPNHSRYFQTVVDDQSKQPSVVISAPLSMSYVQVAYHENYLVEARVGTKESDRETTHVAFLPCYFDGEARSQVTVAALSDLTTHKNQSSASMALKQLEMAVRLLILNQRDRCRATLDRFLTTLKATEAALYKKMTKGNLDQDIALGFLFYVSSADYAKDNKLGLVSILPLVGVYYPKAVVFLSTGEPNTADRDYTFDAEGFFVYTRHPNLTKLLIESLQRVSNGITRRDCREYANM